MLARHHRDADKEPRRPLPRARRQRAALAAGDLLMTDQLLTVSGQRRQRRATIAGDPGTPQDLQQRHHTAR
jgi:hypothetical protein